MNTDTEQRTAETPPDGFEERLLACILTDYDELTKAPHRPRRATPRFRHVVPRLTLAAAVPVMVAGAIVAAVIVSAHGSARHAGTLATLQARRTAYIVDRVRANLARLIVAGEGRVLERMVVRDASPSGPAVENTDWAYIDPRTKVAYQRSVDSSAEGTVLSINRLVTMPVHGVLHTRVTFVDPSRHAYAVVTDAPPGGTVKAAASGTALGITSTARQIDQALLSKRVAQQGTATVDGRTTIKLSVPPPAVMVSAGLPARTTITLYVDSRTYQPVQEVRRLPRTRDSSSAMSIARWLPTNPTTIARAKVHIPAGYRRSTAPLTSFWSGTKPLFFIGY